MMHDELQFLLLKRLIETTNFMKIEIRGVNLYKVYEFPIIFPKFIKMSSLYTNMKLIRPNSAYSMAIDSQS